MPEMEFIEQDMDKIVNEEHGKKQKPLRMFTHWLFWLSLCLFTFINVAVGRSEQWCNLTPEKCDSAYFALWVVFGGIFLSFFLYFLPTIVAFGRRHPSRGAIFIVNLVFGLTGLGWIGALIWSFSATRYEVDINWDTRFR